MQAILRSEAEPGARAFLAAPPTGRMESFDNAWALLTQLRMLGALAVILCMPPPAVLVGKEPPDAMPCETPSASVHVCRPCRLTARKEKPGLLFPQRPADTSSARRRPADLFVPSYLGSPTDLTWLSQPRSRQETLGEAARSGLAAASAYAAVKRMHLDTATVCQIHRITFHPLVVEATGAWEGDSALVLRRLAKAASAREGGQVDLHGALLQELSVIARSSRHRAILRRRTELTMASQSPTSL